MRKTQKTSRSRKRRLHRPKRREIRAPRTAKDLFSRPKKFQTMWNRITQIPGEMRSKGITLSEAARRFDVSPNVVTRLIPSAFRKMRNGQYKVKTRDRLIRVLLIPSRKGLREIVVRGSQQASVVGKYSSAVETFLRRGDSSSLRKLRRKSVIDVNGKRVRLLVNLEELENQASAGVLHFESLYGRTS